jgi:hypothetical protein
MSKETDFSGLLGSPVIPEPRTEQARKAERVRQSILTNRISGVLRGCGPVRDEAAVATRAELERLAEWAKAGLEKLNRFPEEPETGDGPCVVTFHRSTADRDTLCAALRVPSGPLAGRWALTHPAPHAVLSWDELVAWVADGTPEDSPAVITVATEWRDL